MLVCDVGCICDIGGIWCGICVKFVIWECVIFLDCDSVILYVLCKDV